MLSFFLKNFFVISELEIYLKESGNENSNS